MTLAEIAARRKVEAMKRTIVLPLVDNIHQVLIAFLRTSEFGEWLVDEEKQSDHFSMFFIRGNWKKSVFGLGGKRVPGEWSAIRSVPMQLHVSIRPSPQDVTVRLTHTASLRTSDAFYGRDKLRLREAVDDEVNSLHAYLRKCYDLPDEPRLIEE